MSRLKIPVPDKKPLKEAKGKAIRLFSVDASRSTSEWKSLIDAELDLLACVLSDNLVAAVDTDRFTKDELFRLAKCLDQVANSRSV